MIGKMVEVLIPERYRERHAQHRSDYTRAPRNRLMGLGLELVGRRKDGTEFPIEVGLSVVETGAGKVTVSLVQDISKRKEQQEAVSRMNHRLIQAHEEERKRIARELHDDIGQRLTVLIMNLDRLKNDTEASADELREAIVKSREDAKRLAQEVQALSHQLHSSKLEYLGLKRAVVIYCHEIRDRYHVEFETQLEDVPSDLPEEVALCLFRVFQEAVQNAIKHSGSARIEVSFNRPTNQMICITVHDSGIGLDTAEGIKGGGLGLVSMRERLKLVGGELSVESSPENGTTVHGCVPSINKRSASAS
jgi:signal transduction histidine kinase